MEVLLALHAAECRKSDMRRLKWIPSQRAGLVVRNFKSGYLEEEASGEWDSGHRVRPVTA
jgi:hypothetical protein